MGSLRARLGLVRSRPRLSTSTGLDKGMRACGPPCQDKTDFGSGLNTVEIVENIANIYKSEPIQYIHKNRYGQSQEQVMRMLHGDIGKDGTLNDPSKWGIKNT